MFDPARFRALLAMAFLFLPPPHSGAPFEVQGCRVLDASGSGAWTVSITDVHAHGVKTIRTITITSPPAEVGGIAYYLTADPIRAKDLNELGTQLKLRGVDVAGVPFNRLKLVQPVKNGPIHVLEFRP